MTAAVTTDQLHTLEAQLDGLKKNTELDKEDRDKQMRATRRQIRRTKAALGIPVGRAKVGSAEGDEEGEDEGSEQGDETDSPKPGASRGRKAQTLRALPSTSHRYQRPSLENAEVLFNGLISAGVADHRGSPSLRSGHAYSIPICVRDGVPVEALLKKFEARWGRRPEYFWVSAPDLLLLGPVSEA